MVLWMTWLLPGDLPSPRSDGNSLALRRPGGGRLAQGQQHG